MDNNFGMYNYILNRYNKDNREVINYFGKKILSDDFYKDIDIASGYLQLLGVQKGDSVAICLPNIPNAIIAFYATNKIGAIANVIHPLVPSSGLFEILRRVKSKVVFVFDMFYKKLKPALDKIDAKVVVCSSSDYLPFFMKYPFKLICLKKTFCVKNNEKTITFAKVKKNVNIKSMVVENIKGDDVACFLHSGGTTGNPKTVELSNRALNACAYNIGTLIGQSVEPKVSMLMVLPLFHVYGLGVCMHSSISAGGRVILMPKFNAKSACGLIKKHRINYITGVPAMYEKLINQKEFNGSYLSSLKSSYCGGDKLKTEIKDKFDKIMAENNSICTLCEGYGLTEATICTVNVKDGSRKNSIGKVLGETKIMVLKEGGVVASAGEYGEICIGGESVMNGYLNDPETTKEVMFKKDSITWVKTGDCGYLDSDGYAYYVDRFKRMIKISGVNVFPSEIEKIVYDNINAIDKCAVVEYQENLKNCLKLYVVLKEGEVLTSVMRTDILSVISNKLMKYSLPKSIVVKEKLPLTDIGKVDYNKIQQNELKGDNL